MATTRKKTAKKSSAKKATRRPAARKSAKKATRSPARKRTPNPAFMKPMTPTPQLAAVVGDRPMPRTEITSRLWAYIKKNKLQDSEERRMINADDKLRSVFGGKNRVSMFDMTKLVNKHLS